MGRNRQRATRGLTFGDFIRKRGMRSRQNRFKWKNKDAQRPKGSAALAKRKMSRQWSAKKSRAFEQLLVAREVEAYDRLRAVEEEESRRWRNSESTRVPLHDQENATACSESAEQDMAMDLAPQVSLGPPVVVDEDDFRARVLESVVGTLFPTAGPGDTAMADDQQKQEAEAPMLDELDRRSVRRIIRDAIFWKAKRQQFAYAPLYWFVRDDKAVVECFVTPRVITLLMEEMITVKEPLERSLRSLVLKTISATLPWLTHTVLRSLYEWSSTYLQQEKQLCGRSLAVRDLVQDGLCGSGHGLVELFHAIVQQHAQGAVAAEGQSSIVVGGAGGAGKPSKALFADPFVLLCRTWGTFIRSPQLLTLHADVLVPATALLARARPSLGPSLLSLLLSRWAVRDSAKEICCVRLLGALLRVLTPEAAFGIKAVDGSLPSRVPSARAELCKRLPMLMQSPQAQVAHEAMKMIDGSMFIFLRYVVGLPEMLAGVCEALYASKSHWKPQVRELSEKLFDALLDYA